MIKIIVSVLLVGCLLSACTTQKLNKEAAVLAVDNADELALLDRVQLQTFNYMWDGGEPISGAARERLHMDDVYPQHDKDIVTSGGTGFGIMAIIVGIERQFISRQEGYERLLKLCKWLQVADRFHGAWPHWLNAQGRVEPFSTYDDGGDLVETAFLVQGLIAAREYFKDGNSKEKKLALLMDELWKGVDWKWYTRGQNVLYWHWSPNNEWKMNHAVRGYNECTILYILGAASPTHPITPQVWHEGYMHSGELKTQKQMYGHDIVLKHYASDQIGVGPLFWAHYSFMGLDPRGLKDQYADYWMLNVNHALIHHQHAVRNPYGYEGYSEDCWGLTASYTITGYAAHNPTRDLGVISPTAALSSMPYTPDASMAFLKHLYSDHPEYIGKYGPYDAFSEQSNWFVPRYLAIDQLPIPVMIENHRTGLIWSLFMNAPEIQEGLKKLSIDYKM